MTKEEAEQLAALIDGIVAGEETDSSTMLPYPITTFRLKQKPKEFVGYVHKAHMTAPETGLAVLLYPTNYFNQKVLVKEIE